VDLLIFIDESHRQRRVSSHTGDWLLTTDRQIQRGKEGGRSTAWRQRWSLPAPACGSAKLNASQKNSSFTGLLEEKCCKINKTT